MRDYDQWSRGARIAYACTFPVGPVALWFAYLLWVGVAGVAMLVWLPFCRRRRV